MKRFAVLLPLLLLMSGCGDTWETFTNWNFGGGHDRAVSADRAPAAAAGTLAPSVRTTEPGGCYRGKLTGEGQTCQAMRTENGGLLTLAGPLRGFGTGDSVCVCGVPASQQFCKQGLTLLVRDIDVTCADIQ